MEIFATLLAGLGLFFVGVKLIGGNLKRLTGRRFRSMVAVATDNHARGSLLGFAAGAITQNVNAVIFILITLNRAGLMDLKRAMPIIGFANLGTAVLVLLSTISMHMTVLILVGVAGLAFHYDNQRSEHYRYLVGALLGVGLLLLGLDFIKTGAGSLKELELVKDFLVWSAQSMTLLFAVGCLLTLVTQSGSTVTIITIALSSAGVITVEHAMIAIYGSGIGSGLSALFMGASLRGEGRQFILFQFLTKALGTLLLLLLFAVEQLAELPLVLAGLQALTGADTGLALALAYIVVQLSADVAAHFVHGPLVRYIRARAPASGVEVLGRPEYLFDQALNEPETALVLVDREQSRLVSRLPAFLDTVRAEGTSEHSPEVLLSAGKHVAEACDRFLSDLIAQHDAKTTMDAGMLLKNRNRLIVSLQNTLAELVTEIHAQQSAHANGHGADFILEPLHLLLSTLDEAIRSGDEEDRILLRQMTHDRGEMMDQVRNRLLNTPETTDMPARHAIFTETTLFERCVWLLRQFLVLTDPLRESQTGAAIEQQESQATA